MTNVSRSLRERRVFVDSSAYLALLDEDDEHHASAAGILSHIAEQRFRQFITNAILTESHALILSSMGIRTATRFLRDIDRSNSAVVRRIRCLRIRGMEDYFCAQELQARNALRRVTEHEDLVGRDKLQLVMRLRTLGDYCPSRARLGHAVRRAEYEEAPAT